MRAGLILAVLLALAGGSGCSADNASENDVHSDEIPVDGGDVSWTEEASIGDVDTMLAEELSSSDEGTDGDLGVDPSADPADADSAATAFIDTCWGFVLCLNACGSNSQACIDQCTSPLSPGTKTSVAVLQPCLQEHACTDPAGKTDADCVRINCLQPFFACVNPAQDSECARWTICSAFCQTHEDIDAYFACAMDCKKAEESGYSQVQEWIECQNGVCPICKTPNPSDLAEKECRTCVSEHCGTMCPAEVDACLNLGGTATCEEAISCYIACPRNDVVCTGTCSYSAAFQSNCAMTALTTCLDTNCADAASWTDCAVQALDGACKTEYTACVNSSS
jgi:hypothetical protein